MKVTLDGYLELVKQPLEILEAINKLEKFNKTLLHEGKVGAWTHSLLSDIKEMTESVVKDT